MGTRLTVSLLGGFRVEVDGGAIPERAWRQRRAAALVKLLALALRHRMTRDELIDHLWQDLDPTAAAANLRKAAHVARRALGTPEAITLEGGSVELWPGADISTDVERFSETARAALDADDAAACREAAAAYSGDLLPDERYEAWATGPRDRIRALYLSVLKKAALWERILEVDATDEAAHRGLMRALVEAGNHAGAIRQFDKLRTVLREELGVSPDHDSVTLFESILAVEAPEPPTQADRVAALLARGLVAWNRRDFQGAQHAAEEARTIAVDAGLGREVGEASALLGMVAHAQGKWQELFREEFEETIATTPAFAPLVFEAHLCLAEFSLHGPDGHEKVAEFTRDLLAVAEEAASTAGRALATLMLGETHLLSGRLEEAERYLTRAARLHEESDATSGRSLSLERLAEVAIARGRRWQARRLLATAGRLAENTSLRSHLIVRINGAAIWAAPDADASLAAVLSSDEFHGTTQICEPCSMGYHVAATAASARARDIERARLHLAEAERIAGMWQGGPWAAAVWEARATVRRAEGENDQARALFREAADLFGSTGRSLDEARCRTAAAAAAID